MPSPLTQRTLQEEAIARAVAAGTPTDQITAFFDITPHALAAMQARPSFQSVVSQFQEKQRIGMTMTQTYLAQLLPGAWSKVAQALEGPDSKAAYDAAWKVINKYVPDASKDRGDTNVTVNSASDESIQKLANAIEGLGEARNRGNGKVVDLEADPHFHPA